MGRALPSSSIQDGVLIMIIDSLYKLPPPSPKMIEAREKKIAKCKKQMGDKYLLAVPIKRKDAK